MVFYVGDNVVEKVMITEASAPTSLAEDVAEARVALVQAAQEEPNRWWGARELCGHVQNGWAPAAVMIALNGLVAEGRFARDARLRVQIVT